MWHGPLGPLVRALQAPVCSICCWRHGNEGGVRSGVEASWCGRLQSQRGLQEMVGGRDAGGLQVVRAVPATFPACRIFPHPP